MKVETRIFGEIEIVEEKIIHFPEGIIGFPDCKNFTLIFDEEKKDKQGISWLQSIDEPAFALPVMDPLLVKEDYVFELTEESEKILGDVTEENVLLLVTVTAPPNIEDLSVNLQAPLIINVDNRKACQIIVSQDYPVKYKIYQLLQEKKAKQSQESQEAGE